MRPFLRAYQLARTLSLRIALCVFALALTAFPAAGGQVTFTVDECGPEDSGAGYQLGAPCGRVSDRLRQRRMALLRRRQRPRVPAVVDGGPRISW